MRLIDINPKMDDRVTVYINPTGEVCSLSMSRTTSVTVIGVYNTVGGRPGLYLIGWKAGENKPTDARIAKVTSFMGTSPMFKFSQNKFSYSDAMWCPVEYEAIGIMTEPMQQVHTSTETRCKNKTCGNKVFTTDVSCWFCETPNPGKS